MLPIQGSKVRAFIRSRRGRLRHYLVDLIRTRTVNPPGDEHLAAQVMAAWCDAHGIAHEIFEKEPGRTNVVARIGSGRPRILVPLHFDVVPAGDGWETDPFEPVERNGRIIGRGAKDDKGPLAAMMLAAEFLKQNEAGLSGQFILVGAADEEAGSAMGVQYLLAECGLEAEMAIVPDAGYSMRLIDVGEKGALFLKVIADGRHAHGSTPERGTSALWSTIDFLDRIRGWRPEGPASDLFTPRRGGGRDGRCADAAGGPFGSAADPGAARPSDGGCPSEAHRGSDGCAAEGIRAIRRDGRKVPDSAGHSGGGVYVRAGRRRAHGG